MRVPRESIDRYAAWLGTGGNYEGDHPHVTLYLAMTKVPVRRLAPYGR